MSDLYAASAFPHPSERSNLTASSFDREPAPAAKTEKFVSFYVGKNLYAVHASMIAEVIHPPAVTVLPDMPPWLMGISNLRGEIAAVVNLKKLLGEDGVPAVTKTRLVILNTKDSEMALSFPVDALYEMLTLSRNDINLADETDPRHLIGRTSNDDGQICLIDIDRLFLSIRPT